MSRTIVAVFDSCYSANKATRDLTDNGFPYELIDISVREKEQLTDQSSEKKSEKVRSEIVSSGLTAGMQIGAQVGGALGLVGGVLMGLGALQIPGLSLQAIASPLALLLPPLAGTIISALAGGLTGSLLGRSIGLGIPEHEFRQYAKTVRDDHVVVTILADWDSVDPVLEILYQHNPLDLQQKAVTRYRLGRVGSPGGNIRNYEKRERHDRG